MIKLLWAEWLLHDVPSARLLLAHHVQAPSSWTAFARYSFGLTAVPPHGNISLALRLRPLLGILIYYSPHGGASRQFFLTALRRCLTAILFILPCSGAYRQFFLTCLAVVPQGDSFSSASWRRLSAIPFIPLLFKRTLLIFWHGFVLFNILWE
jgi:hypothetical protein